MKLCLRIYSNMTFLLRRVLPIIVIAYLLTVFAFFSPNYLESEEMPMSSNKEIYG